MLAFADQLFRLERTEFRACIVPGEDGWHVGWILEFDGAEREIGELGSWQPSVRLHRWSLELPALSALPGCVLNLPDDEDGEPAFLVYVLQHEPLEAARLEFGEWRGDSVEVVLTGKCHVGEDEPYFRNVPVRVALPVKFDGVSVDETSVDKAEEKVARFFERGLFGSPAEREDGGYLFRLRAERNPA